MASNLEQVKSNTFWIGKTNRQAWTLLPSLFPRQQSLSTAASARSQHLVQMSSQKIQNTFTLPLRKAFSVQWENDNINQTR